jgi:hypothetical protein
MTRRPCTARVRPRWETLRLAFDEIRSITIDGDRLSGVANRYEEGEVPFVVELKTGRHSGGWGGWEAYGATPII